MYNCDLTERSSGGAALLVEEHAPEIREDKVLAIRRRLEEGRYNIAGRIDDVVETLLDLYGG
jgi:anti-sigma28 factor (negative regulator of flagellin synthesis)